MQFSGKRVLIAESDKSFAADFKNMLEKNGGSVCKIVNDGIDAVSECFELNPDIVFVDKNLSFLNGFKTAERLREKGFSGLVVIVSDDYLPEDSEKAVVLGADGIIMKPITEKFLFPWLATKLKRTEEKRELFNKKSGLLLELEIKRIESEAVGIIASSMKISIPEAKELLEKKAKEKGIFVFEAAKLIAGKKEE